jgi:hypothetical protein
MFDLQATPAGHWLSAPQAPPIGAAVLGVHDPWRQRSTKGMRSAYLSFCQTIVPGETDNPWRNSLTSRIRFEACREHSARRKLRRSKYGLGHSHCSKHIGWSFSWCNSLLGMCSLGRNSPLVPRCNMFPPRHRYCQPRRSKTV